MCPVQWDHTDHARSTRYVKRDWERLYRAAVLESDRSKLLQRIEVAEAAILERSRSLSNPPGNNGEEQDAISRALHISSVLRTLRQTNPHAAFLSLSEMLDVFAERHIAPLLGSHQFSFHLMPTNTYPPNSCVGWRGIDG
jgi:hypothetical protein